MSHEIRTPLTSIIGMVELIFATDTAEHYNTELLESLTIIKSSGIHLLSIVNGILDFSKIEQGLLHLEEISFNLNNILQSCLDSATILVKVNVKLISDFKFPKGLCVIGDPHRITQCIFNFLSNSAKFTSKGTIKVVCQEIHLENQNIKIAFEISDSGIGILPEALKTLAQPFTQADSSITRKYGGTGMGLAISKELINLMGGDKTITSKFGKGTTVNWDVILKIDKSHSEIESIEPVQILKKMLILIVDDNSVNQQIFKKFVTNILKHNCDVLNNGKEAFDSCREKQYDLIFMDVMMPVMGGFEAAQKIHTECVLNLKTPIVALTASVDTVTRNLAVQAGMCDFISKPATLQSIAQTIWKNSSKSMTTIQTLPL